MTPPSRFGYQYDDHCWLSISGEQWRIINMCDQTMVLERAVDNEPKQIDMRRAKWQFYVEAAEAYLTKRRESE